MTTLLDQQRITAEIAQLEQMLRSISPNDILGSLGIQSRMDVLRAKLGEIEGRPTTKAELALVFNGRPIHGSNAIQASFGTRALDTFQRAVSTSFALQASQGQIGQRGPAPATDLSSLHITGVTHGSFGFVLEELDPNGSQWLDSSLKIASEAVVTLLEHLASEDEDEATDALEDVNDRLFGNVRELIKLVKESDASMQVAMPDRVASIAGAALERAYSRVANVNLVDTELTMHGILEGILPAARRFEFRSDVGLIKGRVAKDISEEYLQTLQTSPLVGIGITGTFRKRSVRGYLFAPKESYVLVKVVPDVGPPSHAL